MSIQRELSNQEELVHQLDPEPVYDYLLQHRALDQSDVEVIKGEEKLADRNVKLLQHLEELGNSAVELFINALRQSGQLHLASLLDVEHRIKPVHGKGYWEKQRYKGQIAISFQLVAAKVMVKKDSEEDQSPKIVDINAMLTPFKVKHSYENMTLLQEDENGPRARKILEYSYDEDDDDRSCCWCCIPIFCCGSKSKHKNRPVTDKTTTVIKTPPTNGALTDRRNSATSLDMYDIMVTLPSQPSSPIKSGSTFFKTKKTSTSPTTPTVETPSDLDSPNFVPKSDRNSNHQLNEVLNNKLPLSETGDEVLIDTTQQDVSFKSTKSEKIGKTKKKNSDKKKNVSDSMLEVKNQKNGHMIGDDKREKTENKENSDPVIMELSENGKHDGKNKKVKSGKKAPPKSLKTQASGMTRSETYELVERWKSEGRAYQTARDQFFSHFDINVQGRIVRYFEQERSTLVLQISVNDKMSVCTICMTTRELRRLREDYEKGLLHEELVRVVDPQNIVDKMECCAIHLRTVINDEDFTQSYQELS
ncbi:hypothetical protein ACF0H5_019193 [Mactra antiquata]